MKKIILFLFIAVLGIVKIDAQKTNVNDSIALVNFYDSTDGANWGPPFEDQNWNLSQPVNTWFGVTVTKGRVTQLNFTGILIYGALTYTLGTLSELTSFNLENVQLHGKIPPSLGNLSKLTYLNFSNNFFESSIPASFGNLTNLTYLDLSNNPQGITGKIPSSLGNLTHLVYLNLSNNRLTGSIPSSLAKLTNLTYLDLSNNSDGNGTGLSGSIPKGLGKLTKLTTLDLSDNYYLSGSIPASLGNLTQLTKLNFNYNHLSGTIPSWIGNLTDLTFLDFAGNQFSGSIPSSLGKLKKLNFLLFTENLLSGTIPASLDSFSHTQLEDFLLNNNEFTFAGMEGIEKAYGYWDDVEYSNQANIPINYTSGKLSVTAGGTLKKETFEWYKNGTLVATNKGDSTFTATGAGTYYVTVTDKLAPQLTLLSSTITLSGLENAEENKPVTIKTFFLYPNPSSDKINIIINASQNETAQIEVIDIQGKVVSSFNKNIATGTSTQSVNVSALAKGNYFVRIKTKEGETTAKFVKE